MAEEGGNSKRPDDTAFKQQRLPSWQPVLTPFRIIIIFLIIGIIFLPVGVSLLQISNNLNEKIVYYGGDDNLDVDSSLSCVNPTTTNQPCTLTIDIKLEDDWNGPVYVYYELQNYYQNHRRYVASRDNFQLAGEKRSKTEMEKCEPLIESGSKLLNPCGLIAGSFFNDVFTFDPSASVASPTAVMKETGISWESDRNTKFKQPEFDGGFKSAEYDSSKTVAQCEAALGSGALNYTDSVNSKYYCFLYPDSTNQIYLYEMYDKLQNSATTCANTRTSDTCVISPIDGVTNEHFIVWMRTAALPTFRKLYGKIDNNFKQGDTLSFTVQNNFEVASYDARKALVISTLGPFGGKNPSLGVSYIVVGSVSLFLGIAFFIKHVVHPRRSGDASQLKWE